jgi:hypothetical protein
LLVTYIDCPKLIFITTYSVLLTYVEWQEGMNLFSDFALQNAPSRGTIRCPSICPKQCQQVHIDLLRMEWI